MSRWSLEIKVALGITAFFITSGLMGLVVLAPSAQAIVVVPWQLTVPSVTPLDNPVQVVVSGPANTTFRLAVTSGVYVGPGTTTEFSGGFTLPPNRTSPQSFLPVEIPATNLTLGNYTVAVSVGGNEVVNATFRVIEAYNVTTIYQNVTEMKQTIQYLEAQIQSQGYELSSLQNTWDTFGGTVIGAIILMIVIEPIRIVGVKWKRRFSAWVHRLFGKTGLVTRSALIPDEANLPTPDPTRLWHTTCCPLGEATFYDIDGAKFHLAEMHQNKNPTLDVDIVLDEAVVLRLRARGLEPLGIPKDYGNETLGDYYVNFEDLGAI